MLLFLCRQVVGEYGMAHFSDEGKSNGKDYCIFFNSQWARLPQDLNKAVSYEGANSDSYTTSVHHSVFSEVSVHCSLHVHVGDQ